MRKNHGKYIAALLLGVLCLLFTACGEEVPDAGRYLCVSVESDGFRWEPKAIFPEGVELELGTGGRGILTAGDLSGTFRWSLSGTKLSLNIGGERASGTLQDGVLDLRLSDGEMLLHFLREDLAEQQMTPLDESAFDALVSQWCGDWFGRWTLRNVQGTFAETWYDCCASIRAVPEDHTLILTLWDEDGSRDVPMALVEFAPDPEKGTALSTWGSFWFQEVGPGDWSLDLSSADFSDMLMLSGHHDGGGEVFDYEIVLRPWGRVWDDVAKKDSFQLPFRYEWYLTQIETGRPMPEVLPPVA